MAKFYLTTPIYYVNARPHIGHAYSTIAADVVARRQRLLGPPVGEDGFKPVFFLTGTDEHGQKVQRSAEKAGIPPQQFADEVSATFRDLWARMGITNDDYIRTTDERHKRGVQQLWRELESRGAIYLSSYTGQYSVGEEMFVEGPPGTLGPDGKPTETVTEENYFFRLSQYQQRLTELIESGTLRIQPEAVKNEVLSFIRSGLKDLSISRTTFRWGIPVPGNDKHVIYVWLDALANYMTAVGYGSEDPADIAKFAKYWPADLHLVGKEITRFHCVYWPAFLMAAELPLPNAVVANGWLLFEESKMSKSRGNVVRTETILDAFGQHVYAKQFPDATKAQQDLFAADVIRYFLLREIPFGQDGSFSFDALITRYNADLANGYGNLVSRTLGLVQQNFADGIAVPSAPWVCPDRNVFREGQEPLGSEAWSGTEFISKSVSRFEGFATEALWPDFKLQLLLAELMLLVRQVDGYLSFHKPWMLAKSSEEIDRKKLIEVLYTAAEALRIITALLYPVLPFATASVWRQLGLGEIEEAARKGELKNLQWGGLKPGSRLGPLAPIFPRADKGLAQIMTDIESADAPRAEPKLTDESTALAAPDTTGSAAHAGPRTAALANPGATVAGSHALSTERPGTPSHTEAPASGVFASQRVEGSQSTATPQIGIEDFVKIDLRVAQIVVAERIPKADKLLRLEVDLGYERRQILSGIAEWYTPEELLGRRIAIIANLAPRKMRGLESHGMLLAASDDSDPAVHGKPVLASFSDEIPLGSRIR